MGCSVGLGDAGSDPSLGRALGIPRLCADKSRGKTTGKGGFDFVGISPILGCCPPLPHDIPGLCCFRRFPWIQALASCLPKSKIIIAWSWVLSAFPSKLKFALPFYRFFLLRGDSPAPQDDFVCNQRDGDLNNYSSLDSLLMICPLKAGSARNGAESQSSWGRVPKLGIRHQYFLAPTPSGASLESPPSCHPLGIN